MPCVASQRSRSKRITEAGFGFAHRYQLTRTVPSDSGAPGGRASPAQGSTATEEPTIAGYPPAASDSGDRRTAPPGGQVPGSGSGSSSHARAGVRKPRRRGSTPAQSRASPAAAATAPPANAPR